MSADDRPNVEKLADDWGRSNSLTWVDRSEERRILADDLRAAIEADRAAGWVTTAENYVFLQDLIAERDRLGAEVERLRRAYVCAPLGGCVADANRRNIARLRAELEDR